MKHLRKYWVVRALGQKMISFLPGKAGFALNEVVTQYFRGNMTDRVNTPHRMEYGIHTLSLLQKYTHVDFRESRVLEWGTGWHGIDIIIFFLLGAKQIFTLDHNDHLKHTNFLSQIKMLDKHGLIEKLLDRFPGEGIGTRWTNLIDRARRTTDLETLLHSMNIKYHVHRQYVNPDRFDLPEHGLDIFYSNSVLQRIPKEKLDRGLQRIGKKYMKAGGVFYHGVDQSDIYAIKHIDRERFRLAYLQYNEFLFEHLLSCRFNYQNRLRESDYMTIFSKAGFNPVYMESYYTRDDLLRLDQTKLARPFRNKSRLDLGISHTNFFGFVQEKKVHPVCRQVLEY